MTERTGRPMALPTSSRKPFYQAGAKVGELTCLRLASKEHSSIYEWRCSCGTVFRKAGYEVNRISKDKTRKAPVACQACVTKFVSALLRSQTNQLKQQRSARGKNAMARRSDFGRHCGVCCGLPHRRPRVGLCKCGGSFRQEEVA
jgi:hypothetical protein